MDRARSQDRASCQVAPRAVLALTLAASLACMPEITERCRLVTRPTPPPALPAGFAELDALLLRRATDMTLASRHLDNSLVIVFRKDFAEVLLPSLCERLDQARKLAMAGQTVEAGRKYQALLVSSQVLAFAVAVQSMAQYADRRLQPGGQISLTQEKFADEAAPIFEAALGENPREIERAINAHPEVFAGWATLLEEWPARITDGAQKAKVAMVVVDIAFLVVATYQAAGAAAEIVAATADATTARVCDGRRRCNGELHGVGYRGVGGNTAEAHRRGGARCGGGRFPVPLAERRRGILAAHPSQRRLDVDGTWDWPCRIRRPRNWAKCSREQH